MMQEMLVDGDDINTADGLLEFYKNLKNPKPINDLYLDDNSYGINQFRDLTDHFIVNTEDEQLDLI